MTRNDIPVLSGIDHVHIYVPDREAAARWFADTLGFHVIDALRVWATPGGPLTIADPDSRVHLALFASTTPRPSSAVAFATDASGFLQWKLRLEKAGVLERCVDHDLAWSLYFSDPHRNGYEITTCEHDAVRAALAGE